MMLTRRLCKLSSCGIVLTGSNGCSRTLTVSRLWRLPRSNPRFTISAGRACRQSQADGSAGGLRRTSRSGTHLHRQTAEWHRGHGVGSGQPAVPDDELLDETLAVARRVAAGTTQAFRLSKRITHRITDAALSFDAVFATEADAQARPPALRTTPRASPPFRPNASHHSPADPQQSGHSSLRIRYPRTTTWPCRSTHGSRRSHRQPHARRSPGI